MKTPAKDSAEKLSPFDAFFVNPTPENAVRLAIADHQAGGLVDFDFVDQLNRAADILAGLKNE